jgi:hypothetical protein
MRAGIARYPATFEWTRPLAWLYIAFMTAILCAGIASTIDAWRPNTKRE